MRYRQNTKGDILYGPPVKQNAMATATIHKLTSEKGRIVLSYEDYIYTLE